MSDAILSAEHVTRIYPGTVALDDVSFEVRRGKVHALIGENGAGKSTLVRILAGADHPTRGRLLLDGTEVRLRTPRDAEALGLGIIHQELSLFPNLSVVENIFMGRNRTRSGIVVDRSAERQIAAGLLSRLDQPISPDAIVGRLPLGQQQIVEIARALLREVRVLMMDEPTSALSSTEVEALFRVIGDLKARGVGIVYISHKLEELLRIGDYVTVLRDGRHVADAAASEVNLEWIVERMTGRQNAASPHPPPGTARSDVVLSVQHLEVPGILHGVSMRVHAGEVVGIYGLLGAGRTELVEAIGGLTRHSRGRVELNGRRLDGLSIRERMAAGLAIVPEDRQAAGLVQSLSLRDNVTLASLGRLSRAGYLSPSVESRAAAGIAADMRIKAARIDQPITSLSGGNQQKAVIAKCLLTSPKLLLLDEPTRGVDVGARADIFGTIRELATRGMGIVFTSCDLHEVMSLADRVIVMAGGRVTAEFECATATEHALMAAACQKGGATHARQ